MMDGVNAAGVDALRVGAAEADVTGADASRATSSSETIATRLGPETELTAYQAAKLEESKCFHNDLLYLLKSKLGVLEVNGERALVLAALNLCVAVATFFGGLFSDKLQGKVRVFFAAMMAGVMVLSICAAIWHFLKWRRGSREATDLECGGRGWFWASRYWGGVTKGSRGCGVCIYYSTCGRYGSSRLGA
jgi:MFS family permease